MFFGRKMMLNKLEALWQKRTPSLVTCRGRRRIGKSTLIEEFARRTADHFLSIEGQAPGDGVDNRLQLRSFMEQLAAQTAAPLVPVENWLQAFKMLAGYLPQEGRTVVLLDEISWMGGYDAGFAGTLKTVWDKMLKKHENLVVVLCGSVSSWIAENILNSTGFVGRDSLDLVVDELPLRDCARFWDEQGVQVALKEKIDFLSVTGGVPKYLEELNPVRSAEENIRELCFSKEGLLFRDFDQIFNRIFGSRSEERRAILMTLATGSRSVSEIADALGRERNGHLAEALSELELAGFVAKDEGINPQTGRAGRIARYRLKDNYTRFYLHVIAPVAKEVRLGLFQYPSLDSLKGWDTIMGYAFENLVVNHYRALLPYLGLEGVSLASAAPYRRAAEGDARGVQVDLLIQTETTAYVVEVKRRRQIDEDVVAEIKSKVPKLGFPSGKAVRTALVYFGDLKPVIRTAHQLDFLVPVERLFGG